MPQAAGAAIGFFGAGIILLVSSLFISLASPTARDLFAASFAYLGLLFALFLVLFALAAVAARLMQSVPPGAPFFAVAVLYLAAASMVLYLVLPLVLSSLPLLLVTIVVMAPLFVIHFIITFLGYAAAASLQTGSSTPTAGELGFRGFLIGLNAAVNLFLAGAIYPLLLVEVMGMRAGAVVTLLVLALLFVSALLCVAAPATPTAKTLAAWLTPLMPTAWYVEAFGWILFTLNLLGHVLLSWPVFLPTPVRTFCTVTRIYYAPLTGSIVSESGVAANLALVSTAYTNGHFIMGSMFLPPLSGTPVLPHEVGHHLNLAAFGSHWTLVGSMDARYKDIVLNVSAASCYAERITESNVPPGVSPGRLRVEMWT